MAAGDDDRDRSRKRHPIQVVARRTGLSPDLLRAWEKRYEVVEPGRSEGGRRLYSDEDIEHLRLLRRASRAGRRIGRIAEMSVEELAELVREDEREEIGVESEPRVGEEAAAAEYLEASVAAARNLDGRMMEAVLNRAMISLSIPVMINRVASPLMQQLGDLWSHGETSPANEHFASAALRRVLGKVLEAAEPTGSAPQLLVTTPTRAVHEFGALFVAAMAAASGWRVLYLGNDLPAQDIAEAARTAGVDAVALSIVYVPEGVDMVNELKELRLRLPATVPILVGGSAVQAFEETLEEIEALRLESLDELRNTLASLSRP